MGKRTAPSAKLSPKKTKRPTGVDLNDLTDARASGLIPSGGLLDSKVHAWVRQFCSKGSVYDPRFADDRLDVIQLACSTGGENPLYQLKYRVDKYCNHLRENGDEDSPADFADFEETYGVQFSFVGKQTNDTDKVGMAKNRIGFYCDQKLSGVKNLLMFLDDVWQFCLTFQDDRVKKLSSVPDVVVHVPPDYVLQIDQVTDECACSFSVVETANKSFSYFHLPPPIYPSRFVVLNIQPVSAEKVHLVFGGNTKPFNTGFAEQDFSFKKKDGATEKDYAEYFQVKLNATIDDMSMHDSLVKSICTDVLLDSPLFVRCPLGDGSVGALSNLLATFKKRGTVHVEE